MGEHCKHTSRLCASILLRPVVSILSMIDEKDYDLAQRGERVRFIFDKLGLEKSFVAKNIGCEPQAIFQWISRPDTNIKNPLLFKFADLTVVSQFEYGIFLTGYSVNGMAG
jgi:hypothetical protein